MEDAWKLSKIESLLSAPFDVAARAGMSEEGGAD